MMVRSGSALLVVALLLPLSSCMSQHSGSAGMKLPQLPTSPVKGQVVVDGQAAAGVRILVVATSDQEQKKYLAFSTTPPAKDGNFQLWTYSGNRPDGLPAGEYALLFELPDCTMEHTEKEKCPDRLGGRYDQAEESPKKFTVEKGKSLDLGKIELTTQ